MSQSQKNNQIELPPELAKIDTPINLKIGKVASYILYTWVSIGVIALSLRMFLLLVSANADTPFVRFVYGVSNDYLAPFRGIFPSHQVGETGYLDVAALFAIFVYVILGWLIDTLVNYVQQKIEINEHEKRRILFYKQQHNKGNYRARRSAKNIDE